MTYAESNSGALCAASKARQQQEAPQAAVVESFNGRTGAVIPQAGDYTAGDVGAVSAENPTLNGLTTVKGNLLVDNYGSGSLESGAQRNLLVGYGVTAGRTALNSLIGGHSSSSRSNNCIAFGDNCVTYGTNSAALGQNCLTQGAYSFADGYGSIANYLEFIIGKYATKSTGSSFNMSTHRFVVGNGPSDTARSNAFRIDSNGEVYGGSYNSSGADYAELFRWTDGNPDQEDRAGRFVTLEGEHIRLAGPEDRYILGIVSGNPSVVGNVYDDQWQGMFLRDVFGRLLYEDVEVPETLSPDGKVLQPARTERRPKLNPDYDPAQVYVPRSARPEWAAVGLLGKLAAVDDGSCPVNGWARVGADGTATASEEETRFRVMARLDETHVQIMML